MLRFSPRLCRLYVVLLVSAALVPGARPACAQVSAEHVRAAIERGVQFLQRNQRRDGRFPEHEGQAGGVTALCTLALLNCGVPPEDPAVDRALSYLRGIEPDKTYAVALHAMALCAGTPRRDQALIRRDVKWLEEKQIRLGEARGGWSYPGANPDNSNSQFALLALHEAERVGVSAADQTWRLARDYWLRTQAPEGSWSYQPGAGGGTGSMTCAGIGSVIIAAQKLEEPDAQVAGGVVQCCGKQDRQGAVERGLEWLGRHFSVQTNPGSGAWLLYYLYAVERVGRLSAQRFLGGHDWYREGADLLVRNQDQVSGFFKGQGGLEDNPFIATSFALLFLSKGRRPVLWAKLMHGTGDDWNHHRHDVANLTAYVETRWRRELSWQIIDPRLASADDLLEAPVLFLTGRDELKLLDQQASALREYVNRGGFLFAEACCGGDGFDRAFRKLMEQVFPEPEAKLRLLPREHPVWHAEEPIDPDHARPLWGIDIGCRTSVIYCPEDLGCYWELARPGRHQDLEPRIRPHVAAAQSIGINVLAYATNREIKYKLENVPSTADESPRDPLARARLRIAKVQHAGGWNAAPGALVRLQQLLADEFGMRVDTDRHDLPLSSPELYRYHLLFMHGRNDFRLGQAEREALHAFLERGGMLLADAVCGSDAFTRAVRREIEALFPDAPWERIPTDHPLFTTQYGGFDLRTVSRRDPQPGRGNDRLEAVVRHVEPELWGLKLGERYAVVFSPFDLSCALERHESLECRGYTREDAARIAINVVLYSLH